MTSELRERQWVTLRLWPDDRTLLQTLANRQEETRDRYSALCALIPLVRELKLSDIRNRERQALRLGIPQELHNELEQVKQETGHSITDILLETARIYAKRHPLPDE